MDASKHAIGISNFECGSQLLNIISIVVLGVFLGITVWGSDLEYTDMKIKRRDLEFGTRTLHATRGKPKTGIHTSIDGLNSLNGLMPVLPATVISYISNVTEAKLYPWFNEDQYHLCDLTFDRLIDLSYKKGHNITEELKSFDEGGDMMHMEMRLPRSNGEVCGVGSTLLERNAARIAIKAEKWSNEAKQLHYDYIGFLDEKDEMCQWLMHRNDNKTRSELDASGTHLKWKNTVESEFCKTVSPDHVYMWDENVLFGFGGSIIAYDIFGCFLFLVFIWQIMATIGMFSFHRKEEYTGANDAISYDQNNSVKMALFFVTFLVIIMYGTTSLVRFQNFHRTRQYSLASIKDWHRGTYDDTDSEWKNSNWETQQATTIYQARMDPSGSSTFVFVTIALAFYMFYLFYEFARKLTQRSMLENDYMGQGGGQLGPAPMMYPPTTSSGADDLAESQSGLDSIGKDKRKVVWSDAGQSSTEAGMATKQPEWKLSSFGIKSNTSRIKQTTHTPAHTEFGLKFTRNTFDFNLDYDCDKLFYYLNYDLDAIFRVLVVPAILLCEFSVRTVYAYDVEFQAIFLGAIALGLIDFFMITFQKLVYLMCSIEGCDGNHNVMIKVGLVIPWALDVLALVLRTVIFAGMLYVSDNTRNGNVLHINYDLTLESSTENSGFKAILIGIYVVLMVVSLVRISMIMYYMNCNSPDMVEVNEKLNLTSHILTFWSFFIILCVSFSLHFNSEVRSMDIQTDIKNDWYGQQLVSWKGGYMPLMRS